MEYKLKPINIEANSPEETVFPALKERIIEKRGEVLEFSLDDIEYNLKQLIGKRKELEAKLKYETMKKDNIETHHPFVKDISEQDLFTTHMYQEACIWVKTCEDKIKEIDEQIKKDESEVAEIKSQIPELADIVSPFHDGIETGEDKK